MSNPLMNILKGMGNNPIQNLLMNQLQQVNPQGYSFIQNAMKSKQNPETLLDNLLKQRNLSGNQLNQLKQQAQQYGVPSNVLNKLG